MRKILLLLLFLSAVVLGQRRSEAEVLRSRRRMLMDPRRWREGERSLGEGVRRAPPVLARGVFDITSKRGEGNSDLESLKLKAEEEEEEETPFDNIFFTFCCGDNLTCLKDSMVCNGSFDCPDGEDEVQCEKETKEEEEQQLKKKEENFSKDLVSIHTKVAKEAQARLKEEAKEVMIDGRKAKVKRRRRFRKVIKESESDEKEEKELTTKAEVETGRRKGVATKVRRRRKKVRKESGANKQVLEEETDIQSNESDFMEAKGDEIEDVAIETTEIPKFWDGDTLSMTTESSETEEPMKEVVTELSTENADHVGFERMEGGRVLLVGGRKVRVNKRRRQKAPAMKSLPVLASSSDSDSNDSLEPLPASSSSQLYSVEQLRQFLGQRPVQSQRQAANKGNEDEVGSDTESLVSTEFPATSPDTTPAAPARSFQGTWIFDSFQTSKRKEKFSEAKVFKNPPLPGPALPPGFFASFDAQFV